MVPYERLAALERSGARGVVVTVVEAQGSTPRKAGARMVCLVDGTTEGTVGGGAVEHRAVEVAREVLREGVPRLVEVKLGPELGMCCGGGMHLYFEPLGGAVPFILLGGGHIARACANLLTPLGFSVHVVDQREGCATPVNFPQAASCHDGMDPSDLDKLPFGPDAYVLVVTHDHQLDQVVVERCLRRPSRWMGLVASRRKALTTRDRCLAKGFTAQEVGRLRSPVGLDLGGQTPEEIALAIAAEVVRARHKGLARGEGVPSLALDLQAGAPGES
jgi:xanthine dehydrogenase accessory factor